MGKDPSAVVLATALAFCAFCPFFARCDDTELIDIRNGIDSLWKVQVIYQAEFDKVKFAQLQEVIDEIDKVMLGYKGRAEVKMPRIRSLNSEARLSYKQCVGPVFDWCQSINRSFDPFIRIFRNSNVSITNKNIIWIQTLSALESGLEKTEKSLEFLTHFRNSIKELENAFRDISHDVHDDFGPGGFYSEEKVDLQKRNNRLRFFVWFDAIGDLVFGPIGLSLGFPAAFASFGIASKVQWNQKKTYGQIELIDHFFTVLTQKIENATEIVEEMESNLELEKSYLQNLQRVIAGSNSAKTVLLSDMVSLRVQFIPNIQSLMHSCAEYVKWLEHDAPFYQKIGCRTRHSASTFYESESSPA